MPRFIKPTHMVLVLALSGFGGSLAIKSVSMNNKPLLTFTGLLNHPFIISLDRCKFVIQILILLKIYLVEYVPPIN